MILPYRKNIYVIDNARLFAHCGVMLIRFFL